MVNLQCITNMATVSWANSGPDQMQVVSARDNRGTVTTCNSTSSNCTFSQLKCGEIYAISVVGLTSNCSSEPAFAQRLNTGNLANNNEQIDVLYHCDNSSRLFITNATGCLDSVTFRSTRHNGLCHGTIETSIKLQHSRMIIIQTSVMNYDQKLKKITFIFLN